MTNQKWEIENQNAEIFLPGRLEGQSHGDLTSARTAEFRGASAGDAPKSSAGDIHLRIRQIRMVRDVGERRARFEFDFLGQIERLVDAQRQIHGSRPGQNAHACGAKPSNGRCVPGRVDADAAVVCYTCGQPRADKRIDVEPLIPRWVRDAAITDSIRMLGSGQAGAAA